MKEEKCGRFAKEQETCRKNVEHAFSVLPSWWAIILHPARTRSHGTMYEVMTAFVIMHNMIVKNEHDDILVD
jgi:hypothetical protein